MWEQCCHLTRCFRLMEPNGFGFGSLDTKLLKDDFVAMSRKNSKRKPFQTPNPLDKGTNLQLKNRC